MTTPIYGLPSPALAANADGPAAFSALASRVERELPMLRAMTNSEGLGTALALGIPVQAQAATVATAAIGWAEIEMTVTIYGVEAVGVFVAGIISLVCNGQTLRSIRYHNNGKTLWMEKTATGAIAITAGVSTLSIQINVTSDSGSGGHQVYGSTLSVRQFGAPISG